MKPVEEMSNGELKGRIKNGSLLHEEVYMLLRDKNKFKIIFYSIKNSIYLQNYEIVKQLNRSISILPSNVRKMGPKKLFLIESLICSKKIKKDSALYLYEKNFIKNYSYMKPSYNYIEITNKILDVIGVEQFYNYVYSKKRTIVNLNCEKNKSSLTKRIIREFNKIDPSRQHAQIFYAGTESN